MTIDDTDRNEELREGVRFGKEERIDGGDEPSKFSRPGEGSRRSDRRILWDGGGTRGSAGTGGGSGVILRRGSSSRS